MRGLWVGSILLGLFSCPASAQFFGQSPQDLLQSWVFQGQTEQQFKRNLKSEYEMRVRMVDRVCDLEDPQVAKLTVAADADVQRFFREVGKIRKKVDAMNLNGNNNQDINKIWTVVSPLSQKLQTGLFGKESLFQGVMRTTLSEEQLGKYQADLDRIRRRRLRALTRVNVAEIERSMPISADQREKLLKILDAQEIPKTMSKHMDGYVGFIRLAKARKADKDQFTQLFDGAQMKVIQQYYDRYKGWVPN